MKFGWKIIVGSIVGFLGSAFGNVGGVGGGGIFVPMLTLIIGFDAKSAIAISKCKNYHYMIYHQTSVCTLIFHSNSDMMILIMSINFKSGQTILIKCIFIT